MEPEEKKSERLHIRIEPTLLDQLRQAAKRERLPFSLWLRRVLWELITKKSS